jgi:transcriptional regulator with AAA-type ATPase domain
MAASQTMRAWGSRYARLVLERCQNNKRRACRELGISYHTLRSYLQFQPEKEEIEVEPDVKEGGPISEEG